MIRYLQEEQKKRWEELHEIERKMSELDIIRENLEQLKNDPRFKQTGGSSLKKEKHKTSRSAERVRVRRRCTKHAERGGDPPQLIERDEDAQSCSLVLAEAPARFTSLRCFTSVDC